MARKKYPSPPDTLDPTDWWMYCDMLQEAGAPPARWRLAKQVGDSLHAEPRLLLCAVKNISFYDQCLMPASRVWDSQTRMIHRGTAFPQWIRPAQVHLARWEDGPKHPKDCLAALEDAFTPDALTTRKESLALYAYGCRYHQEDYGVTLLRQSFFACHGLQGVAARFDVRRTVAFSHAYLFPG